jgi:ABC-type glycerol-3-phosphate transport system substrate-binding protein
LYRLTSVTTLKVLMSVSEDEYAQFQELEAIFHKKYEGQKLRIRSEHVTWPDLKRRIKQERIDVIIFDVTRRLELLREKFQQEPVLLKPLDDHRLFIPSSVYPPLLDNVTFNKRLYFLPYRPNVRIGWWNSHHPTARAYTSKGEPPGLPTTWQDVKKFAEFQQASRGDHSYEARLDQYGVVLSAAGADWVDEDEIDLRSRPPVDAALLLLEVLMASGKKPWQLCESWQYKKEDSPLNVLRDIYKMASPRSSNTDWQTATAHLLSRHVALSRNWSFSISVMRNSGELQNFHPYIAWEWAGEKNNRFRTLLGGDVIALPRYGRHGDEVDKLLRFLMKDAQRIFAESLTRPPMRLDLKGEKGEEVNKPRAVDPCPDTKNPFEDGKCHGDSPPTGEDAIKCKCLHLNLAYDAVRDAIQHAEPTPRFWSPEMHKSFTFAFQALVKTDEMEVASKLEKAAGLYCLAPRGETPKDKKKLDDFIELRFEGDPSATLKEVLPIRVKLLVKPEKDPPEPTSHHTDLCVQLESDNPKWKRQRIWIPAGFTSAVSKPVPALLFRAVKIKKGEAWELDEAYPDAKSECESKEKLRGEAALVSEPYTPLTIVVLPFTLFAFLVLGALIGTFFELETQEDHLGRLWEVVRAPFTSLRRRLLVVLFILVVLQLWFTLERLEYTKEVRQFFLVVPVQAWLIPFALLLGFVLGMVMNKVRS